MTTGDPEGSTLPSPYRSRRLKIILQQFQNEPLVGRSAPTVAVKAADQHLFVIVDFDKGVGAISALL